MEREKAIRRAESDSRSVALHRAHRMPPSIPPEPAIGPDALLSLQRTGGNAAVSRLMAQVQRVTDFEPLAKEAYDKKGTWHGFMRRSGWHVSIFPNGQRNRTFDEFHITREDIGGNKHHFYTDDGHVKLNDLNNVAFDDKAAWATANAMAAEFYQTKLNLHLTAEMLGQEITTFRRHTGKVISEVEHRAAERRRHEKQKAEEKAPLPQIGQAEYIDMFADDEETETSAPSKPVPMETAPALGEGLHVDRPVPVSAQAPQEVPLGERYPAPIAAPPVIAEPLPATTAELLRLYRNHVATLAVHEDVRHRWSDALEQLYVRIGRNMSVAQLKILFDQMFTSRLAV
ncbi:hypothetical protein [Amycolatopsis sp. MEPSY49]|uniref:hypothetical protein n=1 Tax=Amycolatopsis sp. MEPSY49 TaxID=3151600 RepID=UPI003EF953D8